MKCPVCQHVDLVMSERQGVEIDYCPQCRGVWLDRGELDKIIERSTQSGPQPAPRQSYEERSYPKEHYKGGYEKPYHKKKESFLSEIFDF